MDSTLADKLAEVQIAESLEKQFSNLVKPAGEAGANPLAPRTSMKTSSTPRATVHRLASWRSVAFVGSLLAASISVAAWRWSSPVDTAMMARSDPASLAQAAPEGAAPTAIARSSEFAQQLQPMAREFAALRQTVEQLEVRQEQLVRDNENLASQVKASREEMARSNTTIDQLKATQIQMARESQTLTERLNASHAQVIPNASEPTMVPVEPKLSPEERKVMHQTPLPRPRKSANVAQTQKPAPGPARPQAKKPQPSFAWPWSVH